MNVQVAMSGIAPQLYLSDPIQAILNNQQLLSYASNDDERHLFSTTNMSLLYPPLLDADEAGFNDANYLYCLSQQSR